MIIVIEGAEGTGKTSLVKAISQDRDIVEQFKRVYIVKLPLPGPKARMFKAQTMQQMELADLEIALTGMRATMRAREWSRQGGLVLFDRWWWSSLIYYSARYIDLPGHSLGFAYREQRLLTDLWGNPDRYIVLSAPVEIMEERIAKRDKPADGKPARFLTQDVLRSFHHAYQSMADKASNEWYLPVSRFDTSEIPVEHITFEVLGMIDKWKKTTA